MKINKINDTDFILYNYSFTINEDSSYNDIKQFFKKYQKRLNLRGFYRVVVCIKKIGVFMKVIQIDESIYKDTLDLKIEIRNDIDVYYKTEDYFIIDHCRDIYYYDKCYCCRVDDSFDKTLEKVEFGEFIFDIDENIIRKGIKV